MGFFDRFWTFVKEIFLFGVDAFMVAAAREVAKRFWKRLSDRGGAIAMLEERAGTSLPVRTTQTMLPFLDEYRD